MHNTLVYDTKHKSYVGYWDSSFLYTINPFNQCYNNNDELLEWLRNAS